MAHRGNRLVAQIAIKIYSAPSGQEVGRIDCKKIYFQLHRSDMSVARIKEKQF